MKFTFLLFLFVFTSTKVQAQETGESISPESLSVPSKIFAFEEIEVKVLPAEKKKPSTQSTLDSQAIEENYAGQEIPVVISKTPSLTWYSDGGAYSGYSYLRLRGMDQTRISFFIDGVPMNDPEDQVVYLSNFPDFLGSIRSIHIQRGVGLNDHGGGAYAGSVSMQTPSLQEAAYIDLGSSYGSYQTYRLSSEINTGPMKDGWSFYGRYSIAGSEGFRENSNAHGHSFFLSGGYFGEKNIFKLTTMAGASNINLSYLAVPESTLKTNYRNNTLSKDEKDSFQQRLAILSHALRLSPSDSFDSKIYLGSSDGHYNVLFAPDLNRFSLSSQILGGMIQYKHEQKGFAFDLGLNASAYSRSHESFILPFESSRLYRNKGHKTEIAAFSKIAQEFGRFGFFSEIQFRMPRFWYEQDKNQILSFKPITWMFINPKVGMTYSLNPQQILYGSVGSASREPTRNDMLAGFDNIDSSNYDQVGDFSKVKPERVLDIELGTKFVYEKYKVDFNLYHMKFNNEIAAIGELSYIGLPLRKNVSSSYRRGIEISSEIKPFSRLRLLGEANLSRNRIKEYSNDSNGTTYTNVQPLLTPTLQFAQSVEYEFSPWLKVRVEGTYIGQSFLDNTNDKAFRLPSSLIFNVGVNGNLWKNAEFSALVNNICNEKYFSSGYVQSNEPHYFAMATRNYFVSLRQRFH